MDWIKFRDSHCKFEAQPFNMGSMQPLIRANCLEEKTRARTKDLKESYESRKFQKLCQKEKSTTHNSAFLKDGR